jgi:hypothetical protein
MGLLNPLPTGAEALSPELQSQLRKRNIWASIGDGLIAAGGGKPFNQKAIEDRVTGLLDAQLKQQEREDLMRSAADGRAYAQHLVNQGFPADVAFGVMKASPENVEHFMKEMLTGRNLTPGSMFAMGNSGLLANPTTELQTEQGRLAAARLDPNYVPDLNTLTMATAGPQTVGQGSSLVNPLTMTAGFSQPTTRTQEHRAGVGTETQSAKDQEIARLVNQGIDRVTAERVADGVIRLSTDQAGNRVLTDIATGRSWLTDVDHPYVENPSEQFPGTQTIFAGDSEVSTGVMGAGKAIIDQVRQSVNLPEAFPQEAEFRRLGERYRTANTIDMVNTAWEGRASNQVLELFNSLTADPTRIMQGDESLYRDYRTWADLVRRQKLEAEAQLRYPTRLSAQDRGSAQARLQAANSMLKDTEAMMAIIEETGKVRQGQGGTGQPAATPADDPVEAWLREQGL